MLFLSHICMGTICLGFRGSSAQRPRYWPQRLDGVHADLVQQRPIDNPQPVTLVGPHGIAKFIQSTLFLSYSKLTFPLRVYELVTAEEAAQCTTASRGVGTADQASSIDAPRVWSAPVKSSEGFTELDVTFIAPDADGVWALPPEADCDSTFGQSGV